MDKTAFDISYFSNELEYMKVSSRSAGRIEFDSPEESINANKQARRVFRYTKVIKNSSGGTDVFYSNSKEVLELLIKHTRLVEQGDIESIRITGRILGYPECCIDSYINERLYLSVNIGLNWLFKRTEHKGRFNEKINPFNANIRHIPCNLNCHSTLKQIELMDRIFKTSTYIGKEIAYLTPLPFGGQRGKGLCLRDYIMIELLDFQKDSVKYRCVDNRNISPPIISAGDELRFRDGIIYVYNRKRPLGTLILSHFLWSPLVLLDADFYRELFRLAIYYRRIAPFRQVVPPYSNRRYTYLFEKVREILERGDFKGERPEIINNMIKLVMEERGFEYNILIQFNEDAKGFFLRGSKISISVEGKAFEDTPYLRASLKDLLERLEGELRKRPS